MFTHGLSSVANLAQALASHRSGNACNSWCFCTNRQKETRAARSLLSGVLCSLLASRQFGVGLSYFSFLRSSCHEAERENWAGQPFIAACLVHCAFVSVFVPNQQTHNVFTNHHPSNWVQIDLSRIFLTGFQNKPASLIKPTCFCDCQVISRTLRAAAGTRCWLFFIFGFPTKTTPYPPNSQNHISQYIYIYI